jgi:hypothetical protein
MADEKRKKRDGESSAKLPTFRAGGRVRETGIALVHEGEYIVPAAGSEASIEPAELTEDSVINFHFPVQIEIVGSLSSEERESIEEDIWTKLMEAIERLS